VSGAGPRPVGTALRYPERLVYWLLVLLLLVPVWSFPYLPTQDGPLHLANAVILKEYATADARYAEVFQLSLEPFPNWSSHVLLAGLLYALPPLAAEKVLASLYIGGFAAGFRYFLAPFGPDALLLAPTGLLFVFNRCFLMGFYNYCLSLAVMWVVLGYCVRRRVGFGAVDAFALASLLFLAYFTHLLGCVLAASGAACFVCTARPFRLQKLLCLGGALAPVACLALTHHLGNPFLQHGSEGSLGGAVLRYWTQAGAEPWWSSVASVNRQLFEPYEGRHPWMGGLVLLWFEALILVTVLGAFGRGERVALPAVRLPVIVLSVGLVVLYVLLPDFLSVAVGFLKARLALLPPLVCLPLLRVPRQTWARAAFRVALLLLVGLNTSLVARHFAHASADLVEYTAGLQYAGRRHTLFVAADESRGRVLADHLEHAADHYCLTTGNVNLDNFQATLKHFPVRFRPGWERGRGAFSSYPNRDGVDVILVWGEGPWAPEEANESFREVYHHGRLRLLERKGLDRLDINSGPKH
jgi:hypothetical protein